jgi:hypothetical protein
LGGVEPAGLETLARLGTLVVEGIGVGGKEDT